MISGIVLEVSSDFVTLFISVSPPLRAIIGSGALSDVLSIVFSSLLFSLLIWFCSFTSVSIFLSSLFDFKDPFGCLVVEGFVGSFSSFFSFKTIGGRSWQAVDDRCGVSLATLGCCLSGDGMITGSLVLLSSLEAALLVLPLSKAAAPTPPARRTRSREEEIE